MADGPLTASDPHPYKVAFVLDGEVVDTLKLHERMGAILLSDPIIVDISNKPEVSIGDKYSPETDTFSHE